MSFINCHSTFCSSKTPLWVTNIPNEQWLGNNMLQCDKYITVYKTGRKEWANAGPDMITRRRLVPWKVNVKVYDHQSKYEFVVSYLLFMCFPVRPHPIRWTMVMSPTINYGWLLPSTRSLSIGCNTPHLSRDQNFGLNELAAVQDLRNDFNLQDIADEPAVDRGKVWEHGMINIIHIILWLIILLLWYRKINSLSLLFDPNCIVSELYTKVKSFRSFDTYSSIL